MVIILVEKVWFRDLAFRYTASLVRMIYKLYYLLRVSVQRLWSSGMILA